jgi:hypothetical protein
MLKLSEILVSNQDIESFDELVPVIQAVARSGERFFRMDVKPPYPDTPENWEDRLEAAFSGLSSDEPGAEHPPEPAPAHRPGTARTRS